MPWAIRVALILLLLPVGPLALSHDPMREGQEATAGKRPNILLAVADDWAWPHAGEYGDRTVATPVFDRLAREGALFTHAFTTAPSCSPARAAILTGRVPHQLREGGNLWGFLPGGFETYPDLLERAGYHVGYTGKGWGPGRIEPANRTRNPAGPIFKDFESFLKQRPANRPFCFWFGSPDPHRPYDAGSGAAGGIDLATVRVPGFLPDTPEVRSDLADYYAEVQRFDRDVGTLIDLLERSGELDNTLVVATSDNGMPFPRAKANVYDAGARVPLAMRWPRRIPARMRSQAFIGTHDLAPTFLEAAGLVAPGEMTGQSLLRLRPGRHAHDRATAFIERERHANVRRGDLSYPVRAVRTSRFLYVRNLRPDRWPAGDPEQHFAVGPFGDIDGSPTKSLLLARRTDQAIGPLFDLATAKRSAEELYDVLQDPYQMTNLADRPEYASARETLRATLDGWMRRTGDPRAARDDDDRWDRYPYYGEPAPR